MSTTVQHRKPMTAQERAAFDVWSEQQARAREERIAANRGLLPISYPNGWPK
jgi:hypothetical protein